MKKISLWKNEEVIKLFNFMEQGKQKGQSLSYLFAKYADLSGRKPNSVRNYYYAELSLLESDEKRRGQLNIDLSLHQKCEQKAFDDSETKNLISEILRLKSLGFSVRKACLKLSNGDLSEMVRLQNKYRIVILRDEKLVEQCKQELKQKGFLIEDDRPSNVIKMPERKTVLSDSEITSLFMGLVKLVKKQAQEQVNDNLKKQTEFANDTLRKTLVEIQTKDMELKKIKNKFMVVCEEKEKLKQEICILRGENASLLKTTLKNNEKMAQLKRFTKKYENNQSTAT